MRMEVLAANLCTICVPCALRGLKKVSGSLELELWIGVIIKQRLNLSPNTNIFSDFHFEIKTF